MPEAEMLHWIASEGDEVVSRSDTELLTKRGWHFVRAREGHVLYSNTWKPKYLWIRV